MPDDGVMLLHTIVVPSAEEVAERQLRTTMSLMRFIKFILTEIFPGGQLPQVSQIEEHATKVGFNVTRVQALRPHYVRTRRLGRQIWRPARTRRSRLPPRRSTSGT
jgi:cyclopropane-fatty-acyl-phospholipid synthase